jgi:hypothetical protein
VGEGRFELPTSRLSGVRSNQLSYSPLSNDPPRRGATRRGASGRLELRAPRSLETGLYAATYTERALRVNRGERLANGDAG